MILSPSEESILPVHGRFLMAVSDHGGLSLQDPGQRTVKSLFIQLGHLRLLGGHFLLILEIFFLYLEIQLLRSQSGSGKVFH